MSTKRFPEEFKREAASLVLDQGYSLQKLAVHWMSMSKARTTRSGSTIQRMNWCMAFLRA